MGSLNITAYLVRSWIQREGLTELKSIFHDVDSGSCCGGGSCCRGNSRFDAHFETLAALGAFEYENVSRLVAGFVKENFFFALRTVYFFHIWV